MHGLQRCLLPHAQWHVTACYGVCRQRPWQQARPLLGISRGLKRQEMPPCIARALRLVWQPAWAACLLHVWCQAGMEHVRHAHAVSAYTTTTAATCNFWAHRRQLVAGLAVCGLRCPPPFPAYHTLTLPRAIAPVDGRPHAICPAGMVPWLGTTHWPPSQRDHGQGHDLGDVCRVRGPHQTLHTTTHTAVLISALALALAAWTCFGTGGGGC